MKIDYIKTGAEIGIKVIEKLINIKTMEIKLKQGNSFIIKSIDKNDIQKIFVKELTEKSIYVKFLDSRIINRYLLEDFNSNRKVIEDLGEYDDI